MYSPDKFDGTASIPSSSTSLVALVRSTTDFDVSNIVVADPWSNILNLASGNIVDSSLFLYTQPLVIQAEGTGAVLLTFKNLKVYMVRVRNENGFVQMYYNFSFIMQTDRWRNNKLGYGIDIIAKTAKDGAVIVDACRDVSIDRAPCNTDRPHNLTTSSIYEDYYDSVNAIDFSFNSTIFYYNNC